MSRRLAAVVCATALLLPGAAAAASVSTAAAATLRVTAAPLQVWERSVTLTPPSLAESEPVDEPVDEPAAEETAAVTGPDEQSTPGPGDPTPEPGAGAVADSEEVRPPVTAVPPAPPPQPEREPERAPQGEASTSRTAEVLDAERLLPPASDG